MNPGERFFTVINVASGGHESVVVDEDQTVKQLKLAIAQIMIDTPANSMHAPFRTAIFQRVLTAWVSGQCLRLRGLPVEDDWRIEDIPPGVTVLHMDLTAISESARKDKLDVTSFLKDQDDYEYDEGAAWGLKTQILKLKKLQEEVLIALLLVQDRGVGCRWMKRPKQSKIPSFCSRTPRTTTSRSG